MSQPKGDRHKHPPLYFRPAGDGDREWLESVTGRTGIKRNALLAVMFSEYRERHPHGPEMPGRAGIKIVTDERMPPGAAALTGPDHDGKPQVQPVPPASKPARKPRARKAAAAAPAREASAKARCMRRLPKGAFCGSCGHVHG